MVVCSYDYEVSGESVHQMYCGKWKLCMYAYMWVSVWEGSSGTFCPWGYFGVKLALQRERWQTLSVFACFFICLYDFDVQLCRHQKLDLVLTSQYCDGKKSKYGYAYSRADSYSLSLFLGFWQSCSVKVENSGNNHQKIRMNIELKHNRHETWICSMTQTQTLSLYKLFTTHHFFKVYQAISVTLIAFMDESQVC